MTLERETTARLVIGCADQPGIVATVSGFLYNHGANITSLDQYSTDPYGGRFFMRVEFQTPGLDVPLERLREAFARVVDDRFGMTWRLSMASHRKRTVILASKQEHALMELLWRWKRGELHADVAMVISNHTTHEAAVRDFGVPFHHVAVDRDDRDVAEARIAELMGDDVELVVLARYMQILSPELVARYPNRIINIHHSFLPAFVGANPYRKAAERGVKVIGATAHYVTADLDAGPIIEQDTIRVTHRHTVADLVRFGGSVEREVLARAVQWHLEDRVLVYDNKTVVFA